MLDTSEKARDRRKLIGRSRDIYDGSPNDSTSAAQDKVAELSLPPEPTGVNETEIKAEVAASNGKKQATSTLWVHGSKNNVKSRSPLPAVAKQEDGGTPLERDSTPGPGEKEANNAAMEASRNAERKAERRDSSPMCFPLPEAIMLSIEQATKGEEGKMRDFLGGIVATGGGAQISMFKEFLEDELKESQVHMRKHIMVAPPPRDIDPQVLVWKGATVFGKLRSNDSWIGAMEYDRLGSRQLAVKFWGAW